MKKDNARKMRNRFIPHEREKAMRILLDEFSEVFGELPTAVSSRLLKLCKAEIYSVNLRILTNSDTKPDNLFLIC
jgi:hypothetical protein